MKGYVDNIEKQTGDNKNFRQVVYTSEFSQLVLMNLKPGEDIGEEVHEDVDQFFRIEEGAGKAILNGMEHDIKDGSAVVVPAGMRHNIMNTGDGPLKLYTIYSPPEHQDGTVHKTKKDAEKDDEHFDGVTTEEADAEELEDLEENDAMEIEEEGDEDEKEE